MDSQLRRGMVLCAAIYFLAGLVPCALAQGYREARNIVQRAQDDLQRVYRKGARNAKEQERIDNARKHLSDFDRNLSNNKFDKDRLDSAIDDVNNVVANNTLAGNDRDALKADLSELRRIRATRGR